MTPRTDAHWIRRAGPFGTVVLEGHLKGRPYEIRHRPWRRLVRGFGRGAAFPTLHGRYDGAGIRDVSDLLPILEGPDGSPDSRTAAGLARALAAPHDPERWLEEWLGPTWKTTDRTYFGRPLGIGAIRRRRIEAAPGLRCHFSSPGCRESPVRYARGLVLPFAAHAADEAALRRFVSRPNPGFEGPQILAALSLPPEWIPGTDDPEGLAAFKEVAKQCHDLARVLGSYDFLAGSRGRWVDFRSRMRVEIEGGGIDRLGRVRGVLDMLDAFATQLVEPTLYRMGHGDLDAVEEPEPTDHRRTSLRIAARVLLGDKQVPAIVDLSDRWHETLADFRPEVELDRSPWYVPFPPLEAPNGIAIAGIGHPEDLRQEGTRMMHCVGNYALRCRMGACVILSLRSSDPGITPSTAEIRLIGSSFFVVQHFGPRNGPPSPEAVEALAWLARSLEAGEVEVSRDYTEWLATPRPRARPAPRHVIDDADYAGRLARWSRLMPRHARDVPGLERAVATAVAERILPSIPFGASGLPLGRLLPAMIRWEEARRARPALRRIHAWIERIGPGNAMEGLSALWRLHPRRIRAMASPGWVGTAARGGPTALNLALFVGYMVMLVWAPPLFGDFTEMPWALRIPYGLLAVGAFTWAVPHAVHRLLTMVPARPGSIEPGPRPADVAADGIRPR